MRKVAVVAVAMGLFLFVIGVSMVLSAEKPDRYIVKFRHPVGRNDEARLKARGLGVIHRLGIIDGFAISGTPGQLRALGEDPNVLRIEEDVQVHALGKPPKAGGGKKEQPPETLEWGVDRIDAELVWESGTSVGAGVKVSIIDTGIDKDHPDLVDNIKGGVNYVFQKGTIDPSMWNDDNGHGTHVAGIVAAVDNEIGVIGVAPQAYVYGVKVLNRQGSGYLSDVIAGIQWSIDKGMQVINMSLGTNSDIQSFNDAVDAAYNAGIVVVAAAGNDGSSVDYPAAYASVIAVSATDINDQRPSWSSIGPEVELAAPGVEVRSTWKGGGYKTISGTSMSAPHVAGTAALILAAQSLSNVQVRAKLQDTADDLGPAGEDDYYGYGLVDAEESVTGIETSPKVVVSETPQSTKLSTWGQIKRAIPFVR